MKKENTICCCLPVEVKVRDLDPRLYLALKCVREGFHGLVGSKKGVSRQMFFLSDPIIYFDKGLSHGNAGFYQRIREHGGDVVSLDEEGGIFDKSMSYLFVRYEERKLDYVSAVFLWGKKQENILRKNHNPSALEKCVVTGHPRFDLRKPIFGKFYHELRTQHTNGKIRAGYILFNMSLTFSNNQIGFENLVRFERNIVETGFEEDMFRLRYHYQSILQHYFLNLIKATAQAFPDRTIVVRPAPAEDDQLYNRELGDIPNVEVSREGAVQEWIVDAAAVIHHDCTTGVEAFVYGKPVLSYCPVFDEHLVQELPIKVSERIADEKKMLQRLKEIFSGRTGSQSADREKRLRLAGETIANTDFDASDRIVEEIKRRLGHLKTVTVNPKTSAPSRKMNFSRLLGKVRKRLNRRRNEFDIDKELYELRRKNKFPGITMEEIETRVQLIREADKSLPEVSVRELEKDTFLICRK